MKTKTLKLMAATALIVAFELSHAAFAAEGPHKQQPRYRVEDLGTLGGTLSLVGGVNKKAEVSGTSLLAGDGVRHAFLWSNGQMTDLGTLGGPNSSSDWRPNDRGEVAGNAELSTPDPLGANICGFGTGLVCRGFVWRDGVMAALPTLGGNNSLAATVNNRGQVVGAAETTVPQSCGGLPLQFLPVIWENDEIAQVLPTVAGDLNGAAFLTNRRGQVIGFTTTCGAEHHAVLWHDGQAIDLGNLGGTDVFAFGLDDLGRVVGYSNVAGNETFHAFLWHGGVMMDLGTLPDDFASIGNAIANDGTIIGQSFDSEFNSRAFLWRHGVMKDLNDLVPASSTLVLLTALSINARGQIAGLGLETGTGEIHAFLATPRER